MMAPITPFIAEEVYQKYFKKNEKEKSIHVCDWPVYEKENKRELEIWGKILGIIEEVRKIKSENKKSMKADIILTLEKEDRRVVGKCLEDLKAVTCAKEIKEGSFKIEFV